LESLGHTAELIHLKRMVNGRSSHYARVSKKSTLCEKIKYKLVCYTQKKNLKAKSKKFDEFRQQYLRVSRYYESAEALKKDLSGYDLFLSGGDQVWNPYHKVFSLHYMLDFLPDSAARISYGSSFGVAHIEDAALLEQMKGCLSKYRAIGAREQSGVNIIQAMGIEATQVVDPVFLLKGKWEEFVTARPLKKKYCLVYALIEYPKAERDKIYAFARKRGLQVVILPFNRQNCLNGFKKGFGLSPKEFINYLANAEYVFTNSFHGLAFSILFQKQFILLGCDSQEGLAKRERLIDALNQFSIGDRSFADEDSEINYEAVNEIVENRLSDSKEYIHNAINI